MLFKSPISVVLSCEHGGHRVPSELKAIFSGAEDVLASHRGWDPGALPLAKRFAKECHVPLFFSTVSRLVVELNRSFGHPRLFSEYSSQLPSSRRRALLRKFWFPHRNEVEEQIRLLIEAGESVIHLSIHTFTEIFQGKQRTTDIGLLYDPQRPQERQFASLWRKEIAHRNRKWVIRRNDPYKGSSDGFTTFLRTQFLPENYLGLELEVCQKFFLNGGTEWRRILQAMPASFLIAVERFASERADAVENAAAPENAASESAAVLARDDEVAFENTEEHTGEQICEPVIPMERLKHTA